MQLRSVCAVVAPSRYDLSVWAGRARKRKSSAPSEAVSLDQATDVPTNPYGDRRTTPAWRCIQRKLRVGTFSVARLFWPFSFFDAVFALSCAKSILEWPEGMSVELAGCIRGNCCLRSARHNARTHSRRLGSICGPLFSHFFSGRRAPRPHHLDCPFPPPPGVPAGCARHLRRRSLTQPRPVASKPDCGAQNTVAPATRGHTVPAFGITGEHGNHACSSEVAGWCCPSECLPMCSLSGRSHSSPFMLGPVAVRACLLTSTRIRAAAAPETHLAEAVGKMRRS